jgi:hypothetical protein
MIYFPDLRMLPLLQSFTQYKQRWFKIIVNLIMIFVGLQFIELAYATQYFGKTDLYGNIHVLYAMYLAFIAGLFPNYATIFATELININRKSIREILEVLIFFVITLVLNIAVIYLALAL